ncbi:unnamed protein product [Clonostachys solani]|uniref:Xylanolytic transcriptional activator regulatory domain-containing protein n=1 Tax=Clonostachys solani TaxID=160281 RepID=A0A9N9ZE95_9HYPO|nr:unnamed protein product [Clonostachys solani]
MSIDQIRQGPSLERCQALCLLSIAQHYHGFEKESYINLGIAIRMASWLQLHKVEMFQVDTPSPQAIRKAEAARRTLWTLFCQDILITRGTSILFLSLCDITTLLPCSEHDFNHGQDPSTRATLINRFPANQRPGPSLDQGQSLFASSIRIFYIWGTIQRKLAHYKQQPWQGGFDHEVEHIKQRLKHWELWLPENHTWSMLMLPEHRTNGHDLAYLKVTMMLRLCNIALRQPWVEEIIHYDPAKAQQEPYIMTSRELYKEVYMLFLQINILFFSKLTSECGEDQIFALCVYTCGLLSAYLCKYPLICQDRSIIAQGPRMLTTILSIFEERIDRWPQAARWKDELSSILYYPASSDEKKAQAQVFTVSQLDRPTTSGIETAHLPPAATTQSSTSIQVITSPKSHSSHLVSVSCRDDLAHLYQGCPYPQANSLPQSRTLSQGPRYTMNSQEYDTVNQMTASDHSYTDAQISIL